MLDLAKLSTEARNPETMNLDQMTPLEIAEAMNREDARAVASVTEVLPQVAQAIEWATASLRAGGRIISTWAPAPAAVWAFSTPLSTRRRLAYRPIWWSA